MWYRKLEPGSNSSFKQLLEQFLDKFAEVKITKEGKTYLRTIHQGKYEFVGTYISRFRKVVLETKGCLDEQVKDTIQDGLRVGDFLWELIKNLLKTFRELVEQAIEESKVEYYKKSQGKKGMYSA